MIGLLLSRVNGKAVVWRNYDTGLAHWLWRSRQSSKGSGFIPSHSGAPEGRGEVNVSLRRFKLGRSAESALAFSPNGIGAALDSRMNWPDEMPI